MDWTRQRAMWTIALVGLSVGLLLLGIVARTERPARIRSLAVLPFANLSADPEQNALADSVTGELIATLSQIKNLRVIAQTSAVNVDAVVVGSVMRTGDRVKMSVRLIQTGGEKQLWLGSFDRDLSDLPAVEDEIAHKIAVAAHVSLTVKSPQS